MGSARLKTDDCRKRGEKVAAVPGRDPAAGGLSFKAGGAERSGKGVISPPVLRCSGRSAHRTWLRSCSAPYEVKERTDRTW
mgnify:CR=1 FL=1